MTPELLAPLAGNLCFGCGADNPHGLKLSFELDRVERVVRGRWTPPPEFQGSGGILHGGIIALVLDEAMGKLSRLQQVRAVTAEMKVDYRRPVLCGQEIAIEARELRREGRNLWQRSELRALDGTVLARAEARFVAVGDRP